MSLPARVVANFGATVAVSFDGQSVSQALLPRSIPLLVAGDEVMVEEDGDTWKVVAAKPRSTVLERPDRRGQMKALAANLTHLGIVSASPPGVDTLLIDQFCLAAAGSGLEALVIVNKRDLLTGGELADVEDVLSCYRAAGYPTALIDTKSPTGTAPLVAALAGRSVALVGASGAGKSSIIKRLVPEREIRIGAVSEATGLGAHTTSVTWWYPLPEGGSIIDSPGVRQYSVSHVDPADVREGYPDIRHIADQCRFSNCAHLREPGCAVRLAVADDRLCRWRYENYVKLLAS